VHVCRIWFCCLVFWASDAARADDRVIAATAAGECTLRVEAAGNWPSLRLRAVHPRFEPCGVDSPAVLRVLEPALADLRKTEPGRVFTSLSFGRLIDYPWMVRFLAESAGRDRGWDAVAGKPRGGDVNRYVADVLARPDIVVPLEAPLRRHGYRIVGVSVEKVLVGGFENVPGREGPWRPGRIPFDAQVWFRLEQF
jgi:hypothetical protein